VRSVNVGTSRTGRTSAPRVAEAVWNDPLAHAARAGGAAGGLVEAAARFLTEVVALAQVGDPVQPLVAGPELELGSLVDEPLDGVGRPAALAIVGDQRRRRAERVGLMPERRAGRAHQGPRPERDAAVFEAQLEGVGGEPERELRTLDVLPDDVVLAAVVVLKRIDRVQLARAAEPDPGPRERQVVPDLLPGALDREVGAVGVGVDRPPARDGGVELLGRRDPKARADPTLRPHDAVPDPEVDGVARVPELCPRVPGRRSGVVERVRGCDDRPVSGEVALHADGEAAAAARRVVDARRAAAAERVREADRADLGAQAGSLRQRPRVEQHDPADRPGAEARGPGAFDYGDAIRGVRIDLGGVVDAPVLALVAHAVDDDQVASPLMAADDRLVHPARGPAQHRYAGDPGERVRQPLSAGPRELGARERLTRRGGGRLLPVDVDRDHVMIVAGVQRLEPDLRGRRGTHDHHAEARGLMLRLRRRHLNLALAQPLDAGPAPGVAADEDRRGRPRRTHFEPGTGEWFVGARLDHHGLPDPRARRSRPRRERRRGRPGEQHRGEERGQGAGYDTTSSNVMSASTLPGRSRPAARSSGSPAVFCGWSLSGGR
jgi:hypothetical protein